MTKTGIPFITGTLQERVVVALFSLPLAAGCAWAVVAGELVLRDSDSGGTAARYFGFAVFRLLCTELFVAATAVLLLAFIWVVFQPSWVKKLLLYASRHVWRSVCFLIGSIVLCSVVLKIVGSVV